MNRNYYIIGLCVASAIGLGVLIYYVEHSDLDDSIMEDEIQNEDDINN